MAKTKSPSTKKWGYEFGCDGVADYIQAQDLLGLRSKASIKDLADRGYIRRGKHKGGPFAKVVFCRRSIDDYNNSLEL